MCTQALIEKVLEGANAPVDEAAEERKGGAGDIGKFLLSAGEKTLVGLGHVPKELAAAKGLTVKVQPLPGPHHPNITPQIPGTPAYPPPPTHPHAPPSHACTVPGTPQLPHAASHGVPGCPCTQEWADELLKMMPGGVIVEETDEIIKISMAADAEKGVFPLKVRDAAIDAGFKLLKAKGLVPDTADDSDDDVNYAEAAGVEW